MKDNNCVTKKNLTYSDNIKRLLDELRNDFLELDAVLVRMQEEGNSAPFGNFDDVDKLA